MKTNLKISERNAGFSLMEVIVSVFLISVGLIGALTLINYTVDSASISSSRLVAANLAQEGIEIVRNLRDSNLEWSSWYASVVNGDYQVQYNSLALAPFADTELLLDTNSGLYAYDAGASTPYHFKRKITLQIISAVEVKVVSEVTWTEKGGLRTVTVEDRFWNWK